MKKKQQQQQFFINKIKFNFNDTEMWSWLKGWLWIISFHLIVHSNGSLSARVPNGIKIYTKEMYFHNGYYIHPFFKFFNSDRNWNITVSLNFVFLFIQSSVWKKKRNKQNHGSAKLLLNNNFLIVIRTMNKTKKFKYSKNTYHHRSFIMKPTIIKNKRSITGMFIFPTSVATKYRSLVFPLFCVSFLTFHVIIIFSPV